MYAEFVQPGPRHDVAIVETPVQIRYSAPNKNGFVAERLMHLPLKQTYESSNLSGPTKNKLWKRGRVAEGTCLENRKTANTRFVGSNPTASANTNSPQAGKVLGARLLTENKRGSIPRWTAKEYTDR